MSFPMFKSDATFLSTLIAYVNRSVLAFPNSAVHIQPVSFDRLCTSFGQDKGLLVFLDESKEGGIHLCRADARLKAMCYTWTTARHANKLIVQAR